VPYNRGDFNCPGKDKKGMGKNKEGCHGL